MKNSIWKIKYTFLCIPKTKNRNAKVMQQIKFGINYNLLNRIFVNSGRKFLRSLMRHYYNCLDILIFEKIYKYKPPTATNALDLLSVWTERQGVYGLKGYGKSPVTNWTTFFSNSAQRFIKDVEKFFWNVYEPA